MKELYKVRKISISALDSESEPTCINLTCEFGTIIEEGGILFFETYVFDREIFQSLLEAKDFERNVKGYMITFDNIEIDIPLMTLIEITTHENKLTFKCIDHIIVKKENRCNPFQSPKGEASNPCQLLRVDFFGLELSVFPNDTIVLMVSDVPFDVKFGKDVKSEIFYAYFPTNMIATHNTLTEDLFSLFRESLVNYLSLINGASVQIVKEDFLGYSKFYSYNHVKNISCDCYLCGNIRSYRFSSILFEFDNYVRWNKHLNLNKFINHLCSAQQLLYAEDRAFILILVFEGLCKKYIGLLNKDRIPKNIISHEVFDTIKENFVEILKNQEVASGSFEKLKAKIDNLNATNTATLKFRIILEDLNIQCTPKIKKLIKNVRSTLVHEAELKNFEDYQLLSELIREIILRLINSKSKRHSFFNKVVFGENEPRLSYPAYVEKYKLNIKDQKIISEYDERIKLRMFQPCKTGKKV